MMEPNAPLRWLECHPAFSAAIQDLLLFLTIMVAIAIPVYERWRRRREQRVQSTAFVVGLFGPIAEICSDMNRVEFAIRDFESRQGFVDSAQAVDTLSAIKVRIPPQLLRALEELHLHDIPLVPKLRTAIAAAQSFNASVDTDMAIPSLNLSAFVEGKADLAVILKDLYGLMRRSFYEVSGLRDAGAARTADWLS